MRYTSMDFHTSPMIPDIGTQFDPEVFASTVKNANIESVLVFAKCHHGYTYYPTKTGTKHPNLSFDLLGEQLKALRGTGIKAPIYITVGWSKLDADTHPEWREIRFDTKEPLYAPPVNRGNVCLLPDFPRLHDVEISIRTDKQIMSATTHPDCTPVPFEQCGDRVVLHLPPFSTHTLVTLSY